MQLLEIFLGDLTVVAGLITGLALLAATLRGN